jgi:threonine/homoserine/homoserine lactone efflux protein
MVVGGLILRSFCTGFLAACIVGPVFTLILYRTITQGLLSGLTSALGMAMADGIFFFIAAMSGLTASSQWSTSMKTFELFGGPLMIFFGLFILFKKGNSVSSGSQISKNTTFFWQPLSTLVLTLANPLTIIFFGAIAAQVFPEIASLSVLQIILSSLFLSAGSFSLLTITVLLLWKQSSIDPDKMMRFFKNLSGLGLLLTGCLLIFSRWGSILSSASL